MLFGGIQNSKVYTDSSYAYIYVVLSRWAKKNSCVAVFENDDSTTCKVEITSGESDGDPGPSRQLCGHVLARKYPTNMKLHLKKYHRNEYEEVLQLAKEATNPK